MAMVRLENVVKMYDNGRRAINSVSFSIADQESVCIRGASGSGKTTLMKLIAGVEAPSAGNILVDNESVHLMDADRAANFRNCVFGFLPRNPGFLNNLTILENIAMPLTIRKVPAVNRHQTATEHIKTLGIAHLAQAYPQQLSIMELQLISLARALISNPKILLIDGMDANLTAAEQEKVNSLLYTIWEFGELTMVRFTDRENNDCFYNRCFQLEYGKISEA